MKSSEYRVCLYNAAQVSSMLAMAFGVPLAIGLAEYGKYAAIFALPAFFSSFVQGTYLATIGRLDRGQFRSGAALINVILVSLVFLITLACLEISKAIATTLLLAVLLERIRWETLALMESSQRYVKTMQIAELCALGITISGILFAVGLHWKSFWLPVLLVCLNLLLSIIRLRGVCESPASPWKLRTSLQILFGNTSGMFARIHEELFISIMPYTLSLVLGDREVGAFRVSISVSKLMLKTLPYRYETLMADFQSNPPSPRRVASYFLLVNILAIISTISVSILDRAFPLWNFETAVDRWIIASAGLQSLALVFFPIVLQHQPRLYFLIALGFVITVGLLFTAGYLAFQVSYVTVNLVICAIVFHFLRDSQESYRKVQLSLASR